VKESRFIKDIGKEFDRVSAELERWKTASACELGSQNPNLRDYMEHWEGRALAAEAEVGKMPEIVRELLDEYETVVAVYGGDNPNPKCYELMDRVRAYYEEKKL
jgi:hypothetical protein